VTAPRQIDVHHLGNPLVICCFELDDVIVDPGPESSHHTLVEAVDTPPKRILLTHIHFDHAGATGALVRRWPDVEVWVHERGAPHLIDPSRLTASATRLYGDDMKRLWGEVIAVPEANLPVLTGGDVVGVTTSGTFSPSLRQGIGLALLARSVGEGDEVVADVRGRPLRCRVVKPPFVDSRPN